MELAFTKMHGLGNDFVIVDALSTPVVLNPGQIRSLADRRRGVGCDQVLVLEPAGEAVAARMRVYNADGSTAGQCGNGVRCVADYLRRRGLVNGAVVKLESGGEVVEIQALADGGFRVNMGRPRLEPADIPLLVPERRDLYELELDTGPVQFASLSMGNPHAVIRVDDVDSAGVSVIGSALQGHPAFPESVNVGFMQILDEGRIRLRVYERGSGETPACGSGACAAVVAGRLVHGLAARIDVSLPGGSLTIQWAGLGEPVWMTGPTAMVYEGRIAL